MTFQNLPFQARALINIECTYKIFGQHQIDFLFHKLTTPRLDQGSRQKVQKGRMPPKKGED